MEGCRRVLVLVPSLTLADQLMKQWGAAATKVQRVQPVCSDMTVGAQDDAAGDTVRAMDRQPTRDPAKVEAFLREAKDGELSVVFSTYHSSRIAGEGAIRAGTGYDLAIMDEAHKTTGIEREDREGYWQHCHDDAKVPARKRLYMTATPRIFEPGIKAKAGEKSRGLWSMDDPETYGERFHELTLSKAVDAELLADYQVVVVGIHQRAVTEALERYLGEEVGARDIEEPKRKRARKEPPRPDLSDASKMIAIWKLMCELPGTLTETEGRLGRVLAFTNTIDQSRLLAKEWRAWIEHAETRDGPRPNVKYLEGAHTTRHRRRTLDWLAEGEAGQPRIVANARCLTEGTDVPNLDGVAFFEPRSSQIDVVQAVGRAIRPAEGKSIGWVLLMVEIPNGKSAADILSSRKEWKGAWQVLQALKAHDDRFEIMVNRLKVDGKARKRLRFVEVDIKDPVEEGGQGELVLSADDEGVTLPLDAFYGKVAEVCGDKEYYRQWARSVADIYRTVQERLGARRQTGGEEWLEQVQALEKGLGDTLGEEIGEEKTDAILAQHIVTGPVFEALLGATDTALRSPVWRALRRLEQSAREDGLAEEMRDLKPLYADVQRRIDSVEERSGRQAILIDLYSTFFQTAMRKEATEGGIVYTPIEVVDFILGSAETALRVLGTAEPESRGLADAGVRILDPFCGTGTFLIRLMETGLLPKERIADKLAHEVFGYENMLLAYYVATLQVVDTARELTGDKSIEEAPGLLWTDTFGADTRSGTRRIPLDGMLAEMPQARSAQDRLPIQVIIGNPPYSAGRDSSAEFEKPRSYPEMERAIQRHYLEGVKAKSVKNVYDRYKMAFRWATDRLAKEEKGVLAFITNAGWLRGVSDSGVRAAMRREFEAVYIVDLRGDGLKQGEARRREKGNVFDIRTPVAITIAIRNAQQTELGRIFIHDIGEYLTGEEKRQKLKEFGDISGIPEDEWREVPMEAGTEWFGTGADDWEGLTPLGTEEGKKGKEVQAIFQLYGKGWKTARDAQLYAFSAEQAQRQHKAVQRAYDEGRRWLQGLDRKPEPSEAQAIAQGIRWDRELVNNGYAKQPRRKRKPAIYEAHYRPFVSMAVARDDVLTNTRYQQPAMFPTAATRNPTIVVKDAGSKEWSALVTERMPDLGLIDGCQCYPRWTFHEPEEAQKGLFEAEGLEQRSNVTPWAMEEARQRYGTTDEDEVFWMVYGLFHHEEYRTRYQHDLQQSKARIPWPVMDAFTELSRLGAELGKLHLRWADEDGERFELAVEGGDRADAWKLGRSKMKLDRVEGTLAVNPQTMLKGIPRKAFGYVVNGLTPLEHLVEHLRVKTHSYEQRWVWDPNERWHGTEELRRHIERIVYMSVESRRIVEEINGVKGDELWKTPSRSGRSSSGA